MMEMAPVRLVDAPSGQLPSQDGGNRVEEGNRPDGQGGSQKDRAGPLERSADGQRTNDQDDQHAAGIAEEYACRGEVESEEAEEAPKVEF